MSFYRLIESDTMRLLGLGIVGIVRIEFVPGVVVECRQCLYCLYWKMQMIDDQMYLHHT